jgi:pimeloyl-ACP methyl ester carboxylesterase
LDCLRLTRVDVVGWSDGGIIGLDLAMYHPERTRRLVAISSNFDVEGLVERPTSIGETPDRTTELTGLPFSTRSLGCGRRSSVTLRGWRVRCN